MFFTIFYTLPVIINVYALYKDEREFYDEYGKTELSNVQIFAAIICFLLPVVNIFILFIAAIPQLFPKCFEKVSKWFETPFTGKKL